MDLAGAQLLSQRIISIPSSSGLAYKNTKP
jgi:hypothetical protein